MSENTNETNATQTTNSQSATDLQQVITSKSAERKKKLPLFIGIATLFVICIIVTLSLTVFGGGNKTKKALAQLDLGNKYLDELDFERAEAAFVAALEIDPKNADAYLGLIDVYAKTGDAEKLAQVYKDAEKEFTGSAATDEEELDKVKEKAAGAIEKLLRGALASGDYEKAEEYAEYLAKVDSEKADSLKTQIVEAKAEAERIAKEEAEAKAEEARIAAVKAEEERKAKEEAERLAKEEEERKAALAKELEGVGTGEVITFGHYEQDNDTSNGAEPIDWIVLTKEADRMLVISRYALDCKQYNTEHVDVTWETCLLRNWLKDVFYNMAFDDEDVSRIIPMTIENLGNEHMNVYGGNATKDSVFILSSWEAREYFASDSARVCIPTAYAIAQGIKTFDNNTFSCCWWLRTQYLSQRDAGCVGYDGACHDFSNEDRDHYGIRPAMWIYTS